MVKDAEKAKLPRSHKSNRGHDRFKDLYANQSPNTPATTPDLAHRAPRQIPQSVTPSSENTTGNEVTPVTKTPTKKPTAAHHPSKKNKPKKAKWSHVPSASDGDATHFENFENDGGAQLAVAKMKTRELQWKSTETTTEQMEGSCDAGESYRQELDTTGTGGSGGSGGSAGSQNELRLKALERTQVDDGPWRDETKREKREMTQEEPDLKEVRHEPTVRKAPGLKSPQPSPPKALPPVQAVGSREALKTVQPAASVVPQATPPPPPPPAAVAKPTIAVPQPSREVTKRETRVVAKPVAPPQSARKEKIKASARDKKAAHTLATTPAHTPAPVPSPANNVTARGEVTTRDKRPQTGVRKGGEPTSAQYLLAVKLMKILKRNNYLENALRFEDSEKVRKYYEVSGFAQTPPPQILSLLHRALDFVLETVLFRADDLDTVITNDLRVFIIKKAEAREIMLQVLYNRPDLMPNKWGGARVEAKRSKTSKSSDGGGKRGGWFSSFFRS